MNLNRFKWWLVAFLALISLVGGGSLVSAHAASDPESDFGVTPLLPKDQLSKKANYFDLKVQPGSARTIKVSVTNPNKAPRTLVVSPINATTSDSGQAVYVPSNRTDSSAQTTFKDMTSGPVTLHLAPRQGKTVTFTVRTPASGFTGEVLGGLFVTNPKAHRSTSSGNFTLQNRYAEVVAVALWCQPNQVLPINLKLASVTAKKQNGQPQVLAKLRNVTPALFGKFDVHARVLKTSSHQQVLTKSLKNGSMAPNSWFNLGIGLGKKPLAAGEYTLKVHATSGQRVWNFSRNFTISAKLARAHNETLHTKQPNYWWIWLLLAILLVILLLLLAYWLGKRRSQDDDDNDDDADLSAKDATTTDTDTTAAKSTDEDQSHLKS
ncbi:DUF916 and DUF3324 domain-containing protein [Levilactobacillus suantsaiihabitans]|uniref:DUF916 and DUF3324 domain-containing protein n=1 Tax=Levilactobacillus suantsaiihabitans TaxID=2487722 RepID=A0A4Z0JBF4_9LACO|nr:DUF916 and DUF3324 domain-containing protein [Levilactobacillus suantsaiihabitans]TGD18998.1 DUF916 and DUF3324 domain-containing protein [Levilactobacillus suantsaiihabitans]